ncbi:MAG: ABC transporter ATP-binding protein/permease [Clostridiales bacterium]|nr:ABC transporter ATP-binding protein/permease [Clostridiales bacterium]
MKLENREYKLWDFIKIPFAVSPGLASLRVVDKAIYAMIPALQVLATASFIDTAVDIFNGQAENSNIMFPLACILLLIAHQYIVYALMGLARAKIDIRLTEAFRTAVTDKRAMLEYRHVEDNEAWDLIERVGKDPGGRLGGGFDIVLRMGDMVVRIGAILIILVAQVWWAALAILCFSAPLLLLAVKSGKDHYTASKEAAKHTRRAQYLQGVLAGRDNVEERSLFGYSDELNGRYYDKFLAAYKINMKAQRKRYIRIKSASLITVLVSVLVSGVLIAPLGVGAISVGMFMGFVTATFGLAQNLSWELTYITSELADNREYLRDLTAFARLSETPGATDAPAAFCAEPQCIEFRGVTFKYPGTDSHVLDNLCMKLHAKKHYAFVGINGAGKTTITKLLTGLYDNYSGDILIDGKDLREYKQAELKAMFSIVYQDYAKYQIRMADSIGIGNANGAADRAAAGSADLAAAGAADQAVASAVEALGLTEAVSKLPEGLNTPLGKIKENGVDLSGGEWQRVAIARSLVSSAPVHILDEPTAALDPVAESEAYELFGRISKGKSTIFITHRLGAARLADVIFVIAGGRVSEQGTHSELMGKNGAYAEMFEAQRGWYA